MKWNDPILKKAIKLGIITELISILFILIPIITKWGPCGPKNEFFIIPFFIGYFMNAPVLPFIDCLEDSGGILEYLLTCAFLIFQCIVWSTFWWLFMLVRQKIKAIKEKINNN
jgi:hypothetical protein